MRCVALATIALFLAAAPARAQMSPGAWPAASTMAASTGAAPVRPLRIDADRLFLTTPHHFDLASPDDGSAPPADPFLALEPLLERLPLLPELLRTRDRLTFQWQGYEVKPHVDLHEFEIVVTRRLAS